MIKTKQAIIIGVTIAVIIALFFIDPIPQDPNYHNFVDTQSWLGIPNAANVLSNLGFALVGLIALIQGWKGRLCGGLASLRTVYLTIFLGIFLTGAGSAYYHVSPDNASLVWDRLPMTVAFMAFFCHGDR